MLFEILEKQDEMPLSTAASSWREPNRCKEMILNHEVSENSLVKRETKHDTVVIKPIQTG